MPAPASGEDMVKAPMMKRLVELLRQYYDHIILDSPAGIGTGFRAACEPADRAIVVCNPDPVCVRSAAKVHGLLEAAGISKQRLVINRYDVKNFERLKSLDDLDAVIDEAGIRLLGIVPEDVSLISAYLSCEEAPKGCLGMMALTRIAARLEGETVPVYLK